MGMIGTSEWVRLEATMTEEDNSFSAGWQDDDESGEHETEAQAPDEGLVGGGPTFQPEVEGLGLDGSTPLEAGIQGRLTHAGSHLESPKHDYDWQVLVDVDQPVQQVADTD